jgi:hypothetical protein
MKKSRSASLKEKIQFARKVIDNSEAQIAELQNKVRMYTAIIEALQTKCTHKHAKRYRKLLIGKCSLCGKQFRTKGEIDEIFNS